MASARARERVEGRDEGAVAFLGNGTPATRDPEALRRGTPKPFLPTDFLIPLQVLDGVMPNSLAASSSVK